MVEKADDPTRYFTVYSFNVADNFFTAQSMRWKSRKTPAYNLHAPQNPFRCSIPYFGGAQSLTLSF